LPEDQEVGGAEAGGSSRLARGGGGRL